MRARRLRMVACGLGIAVLLVSATALLLAETVGGAGLLFVLLCAGSYLAHSWKTYPRDIIDPRAAYVRRGPALRSPTHMARPSPHVQTSRLFVRDAASPSRPHR